MARSKSGSRSSKLSVKSSPRTSDKKSDTAISKRAIIVTAIILSLVLYLAGVMSGIFANKVLGEKTEQDIAAIKDETSNIANSQELTEENLADLQEYIRFLESYVQRVQLDQLFMGTLSEEDRCEYARIMTNELMEELGEYWTQLPPRIEAYDKYAASSSAGSEEYLLLKEQYVRSSIRSWIIMKERNQMCQTEIIPVLYMYSQDCKECIEQGEQLDLLQEVPYDDSRFLVLTVDGESPHVQNLKAFYEVESFPAIIVKNSALQGRAFSPEEIRGQVS